MYESKDVFPAHSKYYHESQAVLVHAVKACTRSRGTDPLSIPRVSSVKTQLIYYQLKWRNVSTQGVIIRPIIEPCMRYIK